MIYIMDKRDCTVLGSVDSQAGAELLLRFGFSQEAELVAVEVDEVVINEAINQD